MDWISQELWLWYGDSMCAKVEELGEPITAEWCRDYVYADFDALEINEGTPMHSIFNHTLWHAQWHNIADSVNAVLED